MSTTITISFSQADLQGFSGQSVAIVWEVSAGSQTKGAVQPVTTVAWAVAETFQSTTFVFDSNIYLFAAATDPYEYEAIDPSSPSSPSSRTDNPATTEYYYTFTNYFAQSGDSGTNNQFGVVNQSGKSFYFGLAQNCKINGTSPLNPIPINILPLLYNQQGLFQNTSNFAAIMTSVQVSGSVVNPPSSYPFNVAPGGSIELTYSGATGTFSLAQ